MEDGNNNNNNNTGEENQTGEMYQYNGEESNSNTEPQKNPVRGSQGQEVNPQINYINNEQDLNNQQNAIRRSIGKENPNNADFPNYGEKSSEQRLPQNVVESQNPFLFNPGYNNQLQLNTNYFSKKEPKKYFYFTYIFIGFLQCLFIIIIGTAYEKRKNLDFPYEYQFFKDVHLMIFVGFGLLYSSLKAHQWSSIVIVLFSGIFSFEISFFWNYLWWNSFYNYSKGWERINLGFEELIQIDYFSASVLISLGVLIGKVSLNQILIIIISETFFASLNYYFCYKTIGAIDNGGSLYIYTFGSIFGFVIAVIAFYKQYDKINNNPYLSSNYYSNIISFIGSLFLWLYFPSFNTAKIQCKDDNEKVKEILRYRGIVNTYLSMIGSTIGTFVLSPLVSKGRFIIEHLLNASFVGGIIIGGSCTICSSAWAAILIGFIGGGLSVLGLWKVHKFFREHKMDDTFGIIFIFGIPGILGSILNSIFMGNFSNKAWDGVNINDIFHKNNSPSKQGGIQILAILPTMAIAGASGTLFGLLIKQTKCDSNQNYFVDSELFYEDENIPLAELKNSLYNNNIHLNSSGNKINIQEKEVNIQNN